MTYISDGSRVFANSKKSKEPINRLIKQLFLLCLLQSMHMGCITTSSPRVPIDNINKHASHTAGNSSVPHWFNSAAIRGNDVTNRTASNVLSGLDVKARFGSNVQVGLERSRRGRMLSIDMTLGALTAMIKAGRKRLQRERVRIAASNLAALG